MRRLLGSTFAGFEEGAGAAAVLDALPSVPLEDFEDGFEAALASGLAGALASDFGSDLAAGLGAGLAAGFSDLASFAGTFSDFSDFSDLAAGLVEPALAGVPALAGEAALGVGLSDAPDGDAEALEDMEQKGGV